MNKKNQPNVNNIFPKNSISKILYLIIIILIIIKILLNN